MLPATAVADQAYAPTSVTTATSGPVPGSTVTTFDTPGGISVFTRPPAGFDVRTATPAQLHYLGIPPFPTTGTLFDQAHWEQMIQNIKGLAPAPTTLKTAPAPPPGPGAVTSAGSHTLAFGGTETSPKWSGIVANSEPTTGANTYTASASYYYQPASNYATCLASPFEQALYWTGIGGVSLTSLAQNGSAQYEAPGGPPEEYFWFEDWPLVMNYEQFGEVGADHLLGIETIYEGVEPSGEYAGDNVFAFYWYDYTTNIAYSNALYEPQMIENPNNGAMQPSYNGSTAEFIAENPNPGLNFIDYGSLYSYENEAYDTSTGAWEYLTNENHSLWTLQDNGVESTPVDPGAGAPDSTYNWGPSCN